MVWKYQYGKSIINLVVSSNVIVYKAKEESKDLLNHSIYRVELEGFNHKFYDHSEVSKKGKNHDGEHVFSDLKNDHTSATLALGDYGIIPNTLEIRFHKLGDCDNIILSFTKRNRLIYSDYLKIKKDK